MLIHDKAENWLKTLPDNHWSGCLSDFPYGLKFMGRSWDYQLPSKEALKEIYRVLKPGAHLLGFSSSRTQHRLAVMLEDIGFEIRDCIMWLYGSGFPKSLNISKAFAKNGTDGIAAIWRGWGSCLKPAYEPVIVAMKPLDGTFIQNAEKHGVAGFNIDGCRIEVGEQGLTKGGCMRTASPMYMNKERGVIDEMGDRDGHPLGRYPANIILSDVSVSELDIQTGILGFHTGKKTFGTKEPKRNCYGNLPNPENTWHGAGGDIGGASRFFYCAKSSPSDRNYGLTTRKNTHPTVKPIKLSRYLARLLKQPDHNAIYGNPYSGSGTEMLGFILEGMNVEGCEMEELSYLIAKERVEYAHIEMNAKPITLF